MKAIVITEPGKISTTNRPLPDLKENEVLIKVKTAGICGSDAHIYHGKNAFATYPRVVGHEFAGEVVKSCTDDFKAGNRVVVNPVIACGHCYPCRVGRPNVCKSLQVLGVHRDGGYQEYIAVPSQNVHKIPDNITWEMAAMIEPYTIAAQVSDRGRLTKDDNVLICGAGPIGLILLQAVKMVGARAAIMDIVDSRLEKAKTMGADLVINSKTSNLEDEIKAFTDGDGVSLIFEATGNVGVLETCITKLASPAGRVVVLGFGPEPVKIPQVSIMSKELDILGTRLNNNKFPQVIEWFTKKLVHPEQILSHTFTFDQTQQAFTLTEEKPEEVFKIVLKWQ